MGVLSRIKRTATLPARPPNLPTTQRLSATPVCKTCKVVWCTTSKDCPGSYCQIHGPGPWTCHGGKGPCPVKDKKNCNSTCSPPKPANNMRPQLQRPCPQGHVARHRGQHGLQARRVGLHVLRQQPA